MTETEIRVSAIRQAIAHIAAERLDAEIAHAHEDLLLVATLEAIRDGASDPAGAILGFSVAAAMWRAS